MSEAPIMPVATDALVSDTTHLSAEEFGAYTLILFATWRNNGKPLPDEDRRLAKICRLTLAKWRRMRPVLIEFFDVSDGTWRQGRLEKTWAFVQKRAQVSRKNGAKGGKRKSLKNKETPNPAGNPSPAPEKTQTQTIQIHNQEEPNANALGRGVPRQIDLAKHVFDDGKALLGGYEISPGKAGGLIQKWRREIDDATLLRIFADASKAERHDIVAYVTAALSGGKRKKTGGWL